MSKRIYVDRCRGENIVAPPDRLVIKVNEGEIPVYPGVFYRMKIEGYLVTWKRDEEDSFKVIGKTEDGDIYVSELTDDEMTDEESNAYYARKGITDESFESRVAKPEDYNRPRDKNFILY